MSSTSASDSSHIFAAKLATAEVFVGDGGSPYKLHPTTLPDIKECDTKLYNTIDKSSDAALFEQCFPSIYKLPIKHKGPQPTMRELLDQVPLVKGPKKLIYEVWPRLAIGNWHTSCLCCGRHSDEWRGELRAVSSQPSLVVKRVDLDWNEQNRVFGHTLDWEELFRRAKMIQPVKLSTSVEGKESSQCKVAHIKEFNLADAFMWSAYDEKSEFALLDGKTQDLVDLADEKKALGKFVCTEPTFHTWCYYGNFKPDLTEVLTQLPASLFEDAKAKYFVTTNMPGPLEESRRLIVGNYHIGATTVWRVPA